MVVEAEVAPDQAVQAVVQAHQAVAPAVVQDVLVLSARAVQVLAHQAALDPDHQDQDQAQAQVVQDHNARVDQAQVHHRPVQDQVLAQAAQDHSVRVDQAQAQDHHRLVQDQVLVQAAQALNVRVVQDQPLDQQAQQRQVRVLERQAQHRQLLQLALVQDQTAAPPRHLRQSHHTLERPPASVLLALFRRSLSLQWRHLLSVFDPLIDNNQRSSTIL